MSTKDYSDLTTDAVPDRRNPIKSETTEVHSQKGSEEETQLSDEERPANIKRNPFKGFTKVKKCRVPTAQATIINISNSNGIHVGDKYVYNVNNDRSEKTLTKIKETDAIQSLKKNQTPVQREDLLFIATHMNESWKDTIRQLDYSEGQIEQFYLDHNQLGLKEVIFQLLLSWSQNESKEATIGKLSSILWNNNQQDVVKMLSERDN